MRIRSKSGGRLLFTSGLILLADGFTPLPTGGSPSQRTPPYRLAAVQAFLFYNQDKTLSENVIDNPRFMLWNVVIGEGSAKGASNATLVLVQVSGQPGAAEERRKVRLVATERGRVKLDRASETGILGPDGRYFVPFWLYDTGCSPVKLSVTLVGQQPTRRVDKTIPFRCGE